MGSYTMQTLCQQTHSLTLPTSANVHIFECCKRCSLTSCRKLSICVHVMVIRWCAVRYTAYIQTSDIECTHKRSLRVRFIHPFQFKINNMNELNSLSWYILLLYIHICISLNQNGSPFNQYQCRRCTVVEMVDVDLTICCSFQ